VIYPKLYYAAFRLSHGDVEAARDLAQEALARFLDYRGIERVTGDRHAVSFLIKTCRNLAIDHNARAHEIPLDELADIEAIEAPEQPVSRDLIWKRCCRASNRKTASSCAGCGRA